MSFLFLSKRLPYDVSFNQTVIGQTDKASYEGSSHNHQSLCSPTAHRLIWGSDWAELLSAEERKRLDLRMQNYDYYDCGYQLYSTHRGCYVLVPKEHNADVILFTPKQHTPVKPKEPMPCTNNGCNHGHIIWNGCSYPCSSCEDIAKYKRDLASYEKQVEQAKDWRTKKEVTPTSLPTVAQMEQDHKDHEPLVVTYNQFHKIVLDSNISVNESGVLMKECMDFNQMTSKAQVSKHIATFSTNTDWSVFCEQGTVVVQQESTNTRYFLMDRSDRLSKLTTKFL